MWYDIAESDEDGPGGTTSHDEQAVWTAGRLRRLWGLRSATQQRVLEEAEREGGQELLARLLQHQVFSDDEEVRALEIFVDGSSRFTGTRAIRPPEAGWGGIGGRGGIGATGR